jgi:hypothetical protein
VTVAWLLMAYPFAVLPLAAFGRAGARFWLTLAAFWVATLIQSLLPELSARDTSGWLRALHPLVGVMLVGLGLRLTRAAWTGASTDD